MGIPFTVSAFVTPLVGIIVDRYGGHSIFTSAAAVILLGVHSTIRYSSTLPYLPLLFQGFAYAMYAAALWPAVGASVQKEEGGMAYGLTTALQNIGLSVLPLFVAHLRSKYGNYDEVEILFIGLSCVGVGLGIFQICIERFSSCEDEIENSGKGLLNDDDPFSNLGNDFEETRSLLHKEKANVYREGGLQNRS